MPRARARLPLVAAAAALLVGGCVSAFTNGAGDWTPADGEPTCSPGVGVAADALLLALSMKVAPTLLGVAFVCNSPECMAIGLGGAFAVVGGPTIGVIGGISKVSTCNQAKARWRGVRAGEVDDVGAENEAHPLAEAEVRLDVDALRHIASATGATVDVYGDTLILHATSVERCTSSAWFHVVRPYRAKLVERGITHASCRVAGAPIWEGTLE